MPKTTVQYVTIPPDFAEQRIDNYLMTKLKGVPKTHIYKLLRKGEVRVNKKRAKPTYRLQAGDEIRLPPVYSEQKKSNIKASSALVEFLKTRILYEDAGMLIINKPSGMSVHGGSQVRLGLIDALQAMYPELDQLALAHRLDADTSGCLIIAKKRSVLRELHTLFREGKICKIYHALTKGHWKKSALRVEASLLKHHLPSGERVVRVNEEGKPSVTIFTPIKVYKKHTLMQALLETGRTHQIRVHAQYRGHSIAGDEKYGDKEFNKAMREVGLKRLFLHAYSLEFVLPSTGRLVKVTSPLDDALQQCLKALE